MAQQDRVWKKAEWLTKEQSERLVAAIAAAEKGSRGEVRVHVELKLPRGEAMARAEHLFEDFGMGETKDGTAVLLYVAIQDRKAAVFAGPGIHGAAAEGFWQEVSDEIASGFKKSDGLGGIERALIRIGELLRKHAPGDDDAGNELPDTVTTS